MYDVETKRVNEAGKRNIERFSYDFCFQLTEEEKNVLRFQNGTLEVKKSKGQHAKYLLFAYTEQGIAMLSGLLKMKLRYK